MDALKQRWFALKHKRGLDSRVNRKAVNYMFTFGGFDLVRIWSVARFYMNRKRWNFGSTLGTTCIESHVLHWVTLRLSDVWIYAFMWLSCVHEMW